MVKLVTNFESNTTKHGFNKPIGLDEEPLTECVGAENYNQEHVPFRDPDIELPTAQLPTQH